MIRRPTTFIQARHLRVARLVGEGLSSKEIGQRLGVKAATVDEYVLQIRQYCGYKNRAELAVRGIRLP